MDEQWVKWIMELESIAQIGLTFTKGEYDKERYERLRELAAEMMAHISDVPVKTIMGLFGDEIGYQTPKLVTRAVIFKDDKLLMVKEADGLWSLPGGWCDVNTSIRDNTIKETKEEAGLDVLPKRIIAIQDRNKHNWPLFAFSVSVVFVECEVTGGRFEPNIETVESRYFGEDELPPLHIERNSLDQIQTCFEAHHASHWETVFD
ncbi:MAG: NUDIX hydrolase [Erysipelotrichaceae bacterium]|nr:NUDIX hydrolase [Erysipelotrichaceae bacterium]